MVEAIVFVSVFSALYVAHQVADYWIQTDYQARTKGEHSTAGRLACATHVATYTLTTAAFVITVWALFGLPISPVGFVLGQAISAGTHYWADRRSTLRRLAEIVPGKANFWKLGAPRLTLIARADDGQMVRLFRPGTMHTGVQEPWDNPSLGTGAYALDQSWHVFWLFVAALVTALV